MQRPSSLGKWNMDQNFKDILQGLGYAEKVFKQLCRKEITTISVRLKETLWDILKCISVTDVLTVTSKGFISTIFEHKCRQTQACNTFLKHFLSRLSLESKLHRKTLLKVLCRNDHWKLFLEPWMSHWCEFENLDICRLLVLLDNISSFHEDKTPCIHAHYQDKIGKMRNIAESCFYGDKEHTSKEYRDICLRAIIDGLALVQTKEANNAIEKVKNIIGTDTNLLFCIRAKRLYLQLKKKEFLKKMIDIKDRIPHEIKTELKTQEAAMHLKAKFDIAEGDQGPHKKIQPYLHDNELIKEVLLNRDHSGLEALFIPQNKELVAANLHGNKRITSEEYKYIQGLVYCLEKNGDAIDTMRSLLEALNLTDGACSAMPAAQYTALETAVERQCRARPLQEIMSKEGLFNWVCCAWVIKLLQPALVHIVEREMSRLHKEAKALMGRNLCSEIKGDAFKRDRALGAEFKHECTELVHCNTLLVIIQTYTADSVDIFKMVQGSDPKIWLDSPIEFARVFLKKWMRLKRLKFEDFDVSALCHIIMRCRPLNTLCHKRKVQDVQCVRNRLMHSVTMEISQDKMDSHINTIIRLLRHIEQHQKGSEVTEAIGQIEQLKANKVCIVCQEGLQLVQEAMMTIELEQTHKEASIQTLLKNIDALEKDLLGMVGRDETENKEDVLSENFFFWCICAIALKYIQYPCMLISKRQLDRLYNDIKSTFGPKRCANAIPLNFNSDEVDEEDDENQPNGNNEKHKVHFNYTCTDPKCNCNGLLNAIQNNIPETVQASDVSAMLRETDPQHWLRSIEDFARIFIKGWRRHAMTKLEDCDISALCHIIQRCQPLLSKMDGELVTKVKSVRNKLFHCASLNIGIEEMECDLDVILRFVKSLKTLDADKEIEEAERNIEKLKIDRDAVRSEQGIALLHGIVSDMKLEIQYKKEEAENLGNMCSALKRLTACGGPLYQPARGDSSLCGGSDIATASDQADNPIPNNLTFDVDIQDEASSSGDSDIDPPPGNQDVEQSNTRWDQHVNRFPNFGRDDGDELNDKEMPFLFTYERERLDKEETERKERERLEKEEKERKERERLGKEEKERKERERLEKEEKERKERERLEKEEKERKERERREKEEKERKITHLKEEKKTLEKEIEEIEGHIEMLNINLRQFLRGRQDSPNILGGLFGGLVGGLVAGPLGAVAGAHAGSKIGSSVAAGTLHVFGTYIDATTEDSCEEGIQRLKHEIHERRQRVTYLDQEIAKQQSDLSQLKHNM